MQLELMRGSGTPVYQQIVEQIRGKIISGQLPAGRRLPPERHLAQALGVNRTTVLNAYRELKAEGLIGSHVGQGTVVLAGMEAEEVERQSAAVRAPVWEHLFSEYAARYDPYVINDILQLANRRDVISFAAGIASTECRPVEALKNIQEEFLESSDQRALLVSPVEGFFTLRQAVSDYLSKRGCFCRPEEVMMLSGSQQGIDLSARLLLNPGDVVVVEEPSFFPAIQSFRTAGAQLMGVPMTPEGMDLEILEQLLQRYRPKLIYTMPNFHNPCGVTMPRERRTRLLELSYRYRTVILEDDAYGELCYDGSPEPTLKSMDSAGFVIYLNTFSKTVYPGLRLGFALADKKLIRRMAAVRQLVDLHANCLSQQIIERFLTTGNMEKHLGEICLRYRERRNLMLSALERYAPPGLSWNRPLGGYYIWCQLPAGVNGQSLAQLSAQRGVAFLPGNSFFLSPRQGDAFIRLNYTFAAAEEIDRGVRILCDSIKELLQVSASEPGQPEYELSPLV